MFSDIAAYTALMGRDERRALEVIRRSRERLQELIPKFHGTVIEHIGDGTLSSFQSAIEAVSCARKIQESLKDDPDLRLRIGIHIGDVIFSKTKVFGDALNVASQIHALAEPGGICISERVHDDIRNYPEMRSTFLGEKTLKNVDRPIRVYGVVGEGAEAVIEPPTVARELVRTASSSRVFVGRERELGRLTAAVADAVAGVGRLFLIGGEPGIGKTRLAEEVAQARRRLRRARSVGQLLGRRRDATLLALGADRACLRA